MKRLLIYAGFLLALAAGGGAAQEAGKAPAPTPAEKYAALVAEQEKSSQSPAKLQQRYLDLAKEFPNDPVDVEALTRIMEIANGTIFPPGDKDSPGQVALAILQRDHLQSDKLGLACRYALFGFHRSHEDFLRAVVEKNPHPEVQALACLSLAQFLNERMNRLQLLPGRPELAEGYYRVFGKDYVEQLQRQDRAPVVKEMEALFERAGEKYPDVKIPVTYYGSGGTVGERAKTELFQIRHLAVGQVAPDIEGEDQDGRHFKLSEYRGKVVLIDFWYRL